MKRVYVRIKKLIKIIILNCQKWETIVKKTRNNPTNDQLTEGYKVVDTVSRKGIIHKNKANRLKSRLAKKVNQTAIGA